MVGVAAPVPVVKVVEAVLAGEVGMVALIQGGPLGFRPIGIISPGRRSKEGLNAFSFSKEISSWVLENCALRLSRPLALQRTELN